MKTPVLQELLLFPSVVALKWQNNQEVLLPFKDLRLACPCAFCRGETDALGNKYGGKKIEVIEKIYIIKSQLVGHYGVRFYFSDGDELWLLSVRSAGFSDSDIDYIYNAAGLLFFKLAKKNLFNELVFSSVIPTLV